MEKKKMTRVKFEQLKNIESKTLWARLFAEEKQPHKNQRTQKFSGRFFRY